MEKNSAEAPIYIYIYRCITDMAGFLLYLSFVFKNTNNFSQWKTYLQFKLPVNSFWLIYTYRLMQFK